MLFYLAAPRILLGLALGLFVGTIVHALAQASVAHSLGDRAPRLARRTGVDPRRHFEPFGVVAMAIAGLGWGRPVELTEPRRRGARSRYLASLAAGPAALLLLGLVFLVGGRLAGGPVIGSGLVDAGDFLGAVLTVAGVVAVGLAVLQLVPLPPLDGARAMWVLAPATAGWQRARYYLEEQNYGLGILLVLLLPVFGGRGLIARIVDAVAAPILDLFGRLLGA